MSNLTEVLILLPVEDDNVEIISRINEFAMFVSCDDKTLPKGWYGGTKMLGSGVLLGVHNHLDIKSFIKYLGSVNFKDSENVQLLYRKEDME